MNHLKQSSSPPKPKDDESPDDKQRPPPGYSHWGKTISPLSNKRTKSFNAMFKMESKYDQFNREFNERMDKIENERREKERRGPYN